MLVPAADRVIEVQPRQPDNTIEQYQKKGADPFIKRALTPFLRSLEIAFEGIKKVEAMFSRDLDYSMISNVGNLSTKKSGENMNGFGKIQFAVAPPKDSLACFSISGMKSKIALID